MKRKAVRAAGGAMVCAVVVALLLSRREGPSHPLIVRREAPVVIDTPVVVKKVHGREIVITRIETDRTLLDRMRVPPQKATWGKLSDEELLRKLAEAGRPAGLAFVDGRAELLWREPVARGR